MKRNIFWLLVMGLTATSLIVTGCGGPAPTPEQVEVEVTRIVEVAGETQVETETIIVTATPEPVDPEEASGARPSSLTLTVAAC
jgi:hypothetical protein